MLQLTIHLQRKKRQQIGQWLWLSRQSDGFQLKRSAVRIQPLAKINVEHLFTVKLYRKIGKKRSEWPNFLENQNQTTKMIGVGVT